MVQLLLPKKTLNTSDPYLPVDPYGNTSNPCLHVDHYGYTLARYKCVQSIQASLCTTVECDAMRQI